MPKNKEIKIIVNTANTVPLHMYERLQHGNSLLMRQQDNQRTELTRRSVVIDALVDYIYRHGRGDFEAAEADILRIKSIGLEKKDA